jgi:pimeloyl-ACP methyl ester carboxylesterase
VLIAAPLPAALRRIQRRVLREFPLRTLRFLLQREPAALYHHGPFIDRYLLSANTSPAARAEAVRRLAEQREPYRVFRDVTRLRPEPIEPPKPALIVLGADDPTVTRQAGEELRALTGGELVVIGQAGHDVMLEPGGPQAAEAILDWLDRAGL